MEEDGSQEACEGLLGLKLDRWRLSQGRQGDPVIQTNNKHNGGFWEMWGRGSPRLPFC